MTLKKPQPKFQKRYNNPKPVETEAPSFTGAEMEQAAHAASNPASLDFSAQESEISDAEALQRYRNSLANTVLPKTPHIAGYHVCWVPLTSNNHMDTVDARKQLGYSCVKEEEVPGYVSPSNRAAQYEGCVSHNELILMKLPLRLYDIYMKDSHHHQPNVQERHIKEDIESKLVDTDGVKVTRDDAEMTGMNRLARKVKEPTFI